MRAILNMDGFYSNKTIVVVFVDISDTLARRVTPKRRRPYKYERRRRQDIGSVLYCVRVGL